MTFRRTSSRWKLAGRSAAAAGGILLICMAAFTAPSPTRRVSGQPIEVRSYSRKVIMPDGQVFTYSCWKDGARHSGTCPAEIIWDRLPRWPEPRHVEMDVSGPNIRSLKMDGVVIVDPAEFRTGEIVDRTLGILFGLGALGFAAGPLLRRLPRPAMRPWRVKPRRAKAGRAPR